MDSVRSLRFVAALCFLLGGCFVFNHHQDPHPNPSRPDRVPSGEIALDVTNHNFLDVVVYVVHDGQQTRVGTVTGSSSATFYLPGRLLGQGREIQLLGHPIGGSDLARTETIVVQPGQYVAWTIETDVRRSSVGVY
ncbi:MAG TPA: hypothetical protein VJN39_12040 [Gemmatimonadales bacterium]|nr:hypothetical protein [Gemmatimonadales bacterium]